MRGRRRGAERSRVAERRRRAPRRSVHLKARNALVARVGLLGLLAQDHGLIAAVGRARGRLEAERGALREAEPWRSGQHRRDQAHCGDTSLHGPTSAPPMRPQRTIALIVPGGNRVFGRQSSSPGGRYTRRATLRARRRDLGRPPVLSLSSQRLKSAVRSFAPRAAAPPPASPTSRSSSAISSIMRLASRSLMRSAWARASSARSRQCLGSLKLR